MNVKVKDNKKLKELAKKYHTTPSGVLNAVIKAIPVAHRSFDEVAKKSSFGGALSLAIWNAHVAHDILYTFAEKLGRHDYALVEDFGFDPQERSFWFLIELGDGEKIVDIDQVHVQNGPDGALLSVTRSVEGIYLTDEEWEEIKAELPEYDLEDSYSSEGGKLLGKYYPDSITIDLNFRGLSDYEEMPTLVEANEELNEVERAIREIIKRRKAS